MAFEFAGLPLPEKWHNYVGGHARAVFLFWRKANAVERQAFDSPPVLNSFQRKQYFDFPSNYADARWPPQSGLAEACKLLIKNYIICWNCLYLSQKLEEIKDTASPGRRFSTR